jgi:hypothetical protein
MGKSDLTINTPPGCLRLKEMVLTPRLLLLGGRPSIVKGIGESGQETEVLSLKQACLLQSRRSWKQTKIPSIPRLLTRRKEVQLKTDIAKSKTT